MIKTTIQKFKQKKIKGTKHNIMTKKIYSEEAIKQLSRWCSTFQIKGKQTNKQKKET
jgi:hypothetical protein